jgi:hypothetical protein
MGIRSDCLHRRHPNVRGVGAPTFDTSPEQRVAERS